MDELYEIQWEKYRNVQSYQQCCSLQSELYRQYHNCDFLMAKKKELEKKVKQIRHNKVLTKHFKIPFYKRKEGFYQKIIYEYLWNTPKEMEKETEVVEIVKDILFVYSKKKEEKEYLEWLANDLEYELWRQEEERQYLMDCE